MECSFCNSIYSILYKSFTLINMIPCIEQCELIEVVNKGSNSIFSNLNGKKVSNIWQIFSPMWRIQTGVWWVVLAPTRPTAAIQASIGTGDSREGMACVYLQRLAAWGLFGGQWCAGSRRQSTRGLSSCEGRRSGRHHRPLIEVLAMGGDPNLKEERWSQIRKMGGEGQGTSSAVGCSPTGRL
jgi:hypothetical protein